jgi:hypothetical protein
MHHFQVAEREMTRALDEVRLGCACLRVREGQKEDVREVDELGIDFEDARSGDELRLNAVRRSTEGHERTRELHNKLLAIKEGFTQ